MRVGLLLWACVLLPLRAQEGSFGAGLYQVMEKAACRSCHNADGVASPTRLHFPEARRRSRQNRSLRPIAGEPGRS